jgi:hypothetical protein
VRHKRSYLECSVWNTQGRLAKAERYGGHEAEAAVKVRVSLKEHKRHPSTRESIKSKADELGTNALPAIPDSHGQRT